MREPVNLIVAIVDRHQACRAALTAAIQIDGSFAVSGAVPHPDDPALPAMQPRPNAIVLGAASPDESEAIRMLQSRAPGAAIVMISRWMDGDAVVSALRAGALGYLPEWAPIESVVGALHTAVAGEMTVHVDAATNGLARMLEMMDAAGPPGPLRQLSARERRVLDLLEDGMTPSQIASRLFLSKRTVESHLQGAYAKLSVHSRLEAMWEYKRLRRDVSKHVS